MKEEKAHSAGIQEPVCVHEPVCVYFLFLLFCVLVVVLVNGNDQECAGHRRKLALLNSLPSIWKTNILVSVFHHIDNCSEAKDISQEEDTQRS